MTTQTWTFGPPPPRVLDVMADGPDETIAKILLMLDGDIWRLNAHLLPPGLWPRIANMETCEPKDRPQTESVELPERLAFLEELCPSRRVAGIKGFTGGREYIAYLIGDFVVAECPKLGNALYIFDGTNDAWLQLIQLTKLDLLTMNRAGFVCRVVHQGDWQNKLIKLLSRES